jgi:signal transduction histidine kinase
VLVELGRLDTRLVGGPAENRTLIASAREVAQRAAEQVRDMALLLRPSLLDDLGLEPALKWHAREVNRRTGKKVKVVADASDDDLPDNVRTCVYRVVQEAVNNAARHAEASEIRVNIHCENGHVEAAISDDGVGFDPEKERGMGILGMQERINALGGTFRLQSREGGGTVVSLRLPVVRDAAAIVGAG